MGEVPNPTVQILSGDLVNVSLSYGEFIYLVVCFGSIYR